MNNDLIETELQKIFDRCPNLLAVMIATDDGFAVRHIINNAITPSKLAAMSSSLMSLSESVVREAGSIECKNLLIEAEGCLVVLLRINPKYLLTTISQIDTGIGMLLSNSKRCVEVLSTLMDSEF